MSTNDITGDRITSKIAKDALYRDNFYRIFRKNNADKQSQNEEVERTIREEERREDILFSGNESKS